MPWAAGALATNVYFALTFLGIGLVSATAPPHGGDARPQAEGRPRRPADGAAGVLDLRDPVVLPVWAILWQGEAVLVAIGQEPGLAAQAGPYLRTLQWGLLPFLAFAVLRAFIATLGRPGWALAISLVAIPVNVALAWVLIHGRLGAPALGLQGAGIATSITSFLMCGALAVVVVTDRRFRRWHLFGRFWRPDWARWRTLWRLGTPMAAASAFEIGVFNAAALVIGTLGAVPLAAHSVALQIAATTFMVPLGIGQAATVRVGLASGAQDAAGIRLAGRVALAMASLFMGLMAVTMVAVPHRLIGIFLDESDPATHEVARLAVGFLLLAAVFQLADGLQAVSAGLLRGLQDTAIPMLYAGIGYWLVGAPLGIGLAFWGGAGATGIWIGLGVGLLTVAGLLIWRWHQRSSGCDRDASTCAILQRGQPF